MIASKRILDFCRSSKNFCVCAYARRMKSMVVFSESKTFGSYNTPTLYLGSTEQPKVMMEQEIILASYYSSYFVTSEEGIVSNEFCTTFRINPISNHLVWIWCFQPSTQKCVGGVSSIPIAMMRWYYQSKMIEDQATSPTLGTTWWFTLAERQTKQKHPTSSSSLSLWAGEWWISVCASESNA